MIQYRTRIRTNQWVSLRGLREEEAAMIKAGRPFICPLIRILGLFVCHYIILVAQCCISNHPRNRRLHTRLPHRCRRSTVSNSIAITCTYRLRDPHLAT